MTAMKKTIFPILCALFFTAGCDEKKPPTIEKKSSELISAADLKPPENAPPPVETQPFEDGFSAGTKAGEAAGKIHGALKRSQSKATQPDPEVIALEAAGANPERGAKWQRGFVAGYRDGFDRAAKGIR